jgi:hypothetical protein
VEQAMSEDGKHGYADFAVEHFRPSENVQIRARRGLNGTGQRMKIAADVARSELRQMQRGTIEPGADYGTADIEQWIQAHDPDLQEPHSFDQFVYRNKLLNATGHHPEGPSYMDVEPVPEMSEEMYPDQLMSMNHPLDRIEPHQYNGGKPEFGAGGMARKLEGALTQVIRKTPGKPETVKIPGYGDVHAAPIKEIEDTADNYMRSIGREGEHRVDAYPAFDEDRARRIAEAFDRMQHSPNDPEVRRAYEAMIDETLGQYNSLKDAGIDFKFLKDGQADPYAKSPALGYADLIENGKLHVFPTDQGFGSSATGIDGNPLLKRVGKIGDLENATANDAFRVVHDIYGHFAPGNPFFRHQGEERAWVNHSKMYSPEALPAMTSETRGQNSWLNFGPHAEHNKTALGADTVFADQKIGLLPPFAFKEGYAEGGLAEHRLSENVEDRRAYPGDYTVGGLIESAAGLKFADPLLSLLALGRGLHDEYGIDPDIDRILAEERLRAQSQTPSEHQGARHDTETRGNFIVRDNAGEWLEYGSKGGETPRVGIGVTTPSGPRAHKYAPGGMVDAGAQINDELEGDDLIEPATFVGKFARKAGQILHPRWAEELRHPDPDIAKDVERLIWQKEGVGLNRDGQLMTEIDDSKARLKQMPDFGPDRGDYGPYSDYSTARNAWEAAGNKPPSNLVLPDLLDHPQLYDEYPDLAKLPLRLQRMKDGYHGFLDSIPNYGKKGDLSYMQINRDLNRGAMLDTILHEAQHGVQTLEGWTPGTNDMDAASLLFRQQQEELHLKRLKMAKEGAGVISPESMTLLPQFKGIHPMDVQKYIEEANRLGLDDLQAMEGRVMRNRPFYDVPFNVYQRNEGETMARNTGTQRRLLDEQGRRDNYWKDTEDRQGEPRFVGPEQRVEY